jgi:hypothetical protein
MDECLSKPMNINILMVVLKEIGTGVNTDATTES